MKLKPGEVVAIPLRLIGICLMFELKLLIFTMGAWEEL